MQESFTQNPNLPGKKAVEAPHRANPVVEIFRQHIRLSFVVAIVYLLLVQANYILLDCLFLLLLSRK